MRKLLLVLALVMSLTGVAYAEAPVLMMATTTSTDNTGLLDDLAPQFTKDTGIELRWTAVGTGKALKMGENCDVDILLVHAPAAEKAFVDAGFGTARTQLMYNDFVIIGPAADPAGVKGMTVAAALGKIAADNAVFVSRGDNSGTHKMEKSLWKQIEGPSPEKEAWYVQTGQGMLRTINVAAEKGGYTMTDRGTYIKYEASLDGNPPLKILVEGDKILFNQYSAIPVNPAHCPKVKKDLADKFVSWMASPATQKTIGDFKLMGKALFTPNAE